MNLNIVKTKPAKAKIKSMAASVKMKPVSTGTSVVPSVVHTVAQSLLSMAKTKGKYVRRCTRLVVKRMRQTQENRKLSVQKLVRVPSVIHTLA